MLKDSTRPPNVGVVRFQWTDGSGKGVVTNVVTDTFKEACARLMAGDSTWKPSHIGFMYGATGTSAPTSAPDHADTIDTIPGLLVQISGTPANSNVIVAPLASIPEVVPATSSTTITFNGCSIPAAESSLLYSTGKDTFVTGDVVYGVLLLAKIATDNYKLLARAVLTGSPVKTADRQLAVYWQITLT